MMASLSRCSNCLSDVKIEAIILMHALVLMFVYMAMALAVKKFASWGRMSLSRSGFNVLLLLKYNFLVFATCCN